MLIVAPGDLSDAPSHTPAESKSCQFTAIGSTALHAGCHNARTMVTPVAWVSCVLCQLLAMSLYGVMCFPNVLSSILLVAVALVH